MCVCVCVLLKSDNISLYIYRKSQGDSCGIYDTQDMNTPPDNTIASSYKN